MRALSIRQPWADAIVHGTKRTENRTRPAPDKHVGTRILIHTSLLGDRAAILPFGYNTARRDWPAARGAIVGAATLTGCHRDAGCCTPWGQRSGARPVYHWQLTDVVALGQPVPAKGALGFWTPGPDALAAVYRQIEVGP
jgi:hypothetical protein